MEFRQLKRAAIAFLEDIQDQLGIEGYLAWATPLGLPEKLARLTPPQLSVVEAICDEMQLDLEAYLPQPEIKALPSGVTRKADHFAIYEKHPRTEEVILITCDRTVSTVIKQIQQADPDIAAKISWENYGWDFLISYTPQVQTVEVETFRGGQRLIVERDMRGQRSFPDYMLEGKVQTPGWRTSMPAELVLKQRISDWEIIPYNRSQDIGLANVTSYRHYDDVYVPTNRAEMREFGWRYTKLQDKKDENGYFAEDETGRVRGKASTANSAGYFGFKNTKQKTKSKINSGGASPNPQSLPEYLQLASRQYKLPRVNSLMPAKRFFLYYKDGFVWQKENHKPDEQVARFAWSDDRNAHIPIPMFPLSQGNNRRIWECVEGYLGLRGVKTARARDLEKKIRTPEPTYTPVMPSEVNRSRVGGDKTSKRYALEKKRQAARIKHRKKVRIC